VVLTVADIRAVESLLPGQTDVSYVGVMVLVDGVLKVNVSGNVIAARWADPVVVSNGDPVLVQISKGRTGQGEAIVRCRLTDKPRPGRGVVKTVPPSSPTITVTGSDGIDYTATFIASYTPVVNDAVILSWNTKVPDVVGKVSTTPTPPPPPSPVAPPPPPLTVGMSPYQASDSDTFWPPGGWGSWAGGGGRVFQGNFGSGEVYGAFFYAGSVAQLAGRTITRIRVLLGDRLPVGSNNAPVTVHFYAHTSAHKPGGDVSRVVGPHDVTANPGQGLKEYDLPLSFAAALQGGGGIGFAGGPYAGFKGRREQPDSGTLLIDWRA
jgi:hypothetical protein